MMSMLFWVWTSLSLNFKTNICKEAAPAVDTQDYSTRLIHGDCDPDSPWMPETVNSTKPNVYYAFSYMYVPVINIQNT